MALQMPQLRSLFERALQLNTEDERQAFLDEACAETPDVRAKVEALLKPTPTRAVSWPTRHWLLSRRS